jgi:hypothetical protein
MMLCGLLIYVVVRMTAHAKEMQLLQAQLADTNEAARRDRLAYESNRQNRDIETADTRESFTSVTGVHANINL